MDPITLIIIVVLVLLLFGHFGYARSRYTSPYLADGIVVLFIVIAIIWLSGWHR